MLTGRLGALRLGACAGYRAPFAASSSFAKTMPVVGMRQQAFGQQQCMSASTNAVQPVTIKTPDGAMPGTDSYSIDPYNGKDAVSNGGRLAPGDPSRRAFAYFMMGSARFVYASVARLAVLKFVNYMNASADVLALASIEVPISGIPDGGCIVVKWRGKPVFIKKRTEDELTDITAVDWKTLRDPQSDKARRIKEELLVVLGVCTHLGCVPISNAGDFKGGWFCPCHGSHYDASARIRKGPAPLNLEVPPYDFIDGDSRVKIG